MIEEGKARMCHHHGPAYDNLVLLDMYFKWKGRLNRISYVEDSVRLDGDVYRVRGMHQARDFEVDPFFGTPAFDPHYYRLAYDWFWLRIPKNRATKEKPIQELDKDKLYFLIGDMKSKPPNVHTDLTPTFLLWLTFEECEAKTHHCPPSMNPKQIIAKL